ncbi:hypothetical protein EDC18_101283 [Natranaerovirga pectinivora]|uniref:Purine nucleoside phosphorylase n=1 Tax=Natranaerovirga pectinivora TaxID=682400 RepID=A0A4R3MNY4_9FIRM|nr:peptidoglycan editing factor PgeF [Natranaerovirga pectinivora]TCT16987.1 hypothetical protein EDC18_101283 [Natranaerovirga pectinivora]
MNSNNLLVKKEKDLLYVTFPAFDKTGLVAHCFTTKLGGVSEGYFSTLNLGFNRGDANNNVEQNYKLVCDAIDIDYNKLVFSHQVHEDKIYVVSSSDAGKGGIHGTDIKNMDALITNAINIPLVTLYADCVPIFLLDPVKKAIGIAHAGWRGTVKHIGKKTVQKMIETYQSNPKDILAGIAPSIGFCCFEVSEDVAEEFKKKFTKEQCKEIIEEKSNNKYMVDLWKANKFTLLEAGLEEDNITVTDLCTKCNSDIFFSHRATDGKRGSLAAIMALQD